MIEPFFFGPPERTLFGILHTAKTARGALLVCAPLLQDGIRSQRALWALAEALSAEGIDVMRFDWSGSGDSGGERVAPRFDELIEDLQAARTRLRATTGALPMRVLALRSAALPLIAQVRASGTRADLVLWDPLLEGRAVVEDWRRMHALQLAAVGRYPAGSRQSDAGELLGFDVEPALLDALCSLDARDLALPQGSQVLLAGWGNDQGLEKFLNTQRAAGVAVGSFSFNAADQPSWDDPQQFEVQALPRRSVAELAKKIALETW